MKSNYQGTINDIVSAILSYSWNKTSLDASVVRFLTIMNTTKDAYKQLKEDYEKRVARKDDSESYVFMIYTSLRQIIRSAKFDFDENSDVILNELENRLFKNNPVTDWVYGKLSANNYSKFKQSTIENIWELYDDHDTLFRGEIQQISQLDDKNKTIVIRSFDKRESKVVYYNNNGHYQYNTFEQCCVGAWFGEHTHTVQTLLELQNK